jgi:nucleoside-diphosphate-sugar epimerase
LIVFIDLKNFEAIKLHFKNFKFCFITKLVKYKTKMSDSLVLVTGASGYLAAHIVKQLLEQGYRVRGTVRSLKDEKKVAPLRNLVENPKHPLELCEANLLDENGWIAAVKGCMFVLHTASPVPSYVPDDENEVKTIF